MKIVIFSGTTEGRQLSEQLIRAGAQVLVSVVSEYGARLQEEIPVAQILVGPRSPEEMAEMLSDADLCVDATHPYAVEVTANIRSACSRTGVTGLRLVRAGAYAADLAPEGAEMPEIIPAADRTEAVAAAKRLLAEADGAGSVRDPAGAGDPARILLTTGVRDLPAYAEGLGPEHICARVLPAVESIRTCLEAGLPGRNIIAIQGPFSTQLNAALIRECGACALITKESGTSGGFPEKLEACRSCGIPAIVISRPEDPGMSYEQVLEECLRRIHGQKDPA